ncbi:protein of unknown function [Pseudomonas sp. JV241A]|nr:protein of unknown function [Pseudomonas sp. JV241A]
MRPACLRYVCAIGKTRTACLIGDFMLVEPEWFFYPDLYLLFAGQRPIIVRQLSSHGARQDGS